MRITMASRIFILAAVVMLYLRAIAAIRTGCISIPEEGISKWILPHCRSITTASFVFGLLIITTTENWISSSQAGWIPGITPDPLAVSFPGVHDSERFRQQWKICRYTVLVPAGSAGCEKGISCPGPG